MGIRNIAKDLRENAGVLIEQWADGKFYIVKNRYGQSSTIFEPVQIHPNEIFKMMANHNDVVVVNYKSITGYNHRPVPSERKPSWMREARRSQQSNDDFLWDDDFDWDDDDDWGD